MLTMTSLENKNTAKKLKELPIQSRELVLNLTQNKTHLQSNAFLISANPPRQAVC